MRRTLAIALALACVVGHANARGHHSSGHGAWRPDGLTGKHSRTWNSTTQTYKIWAPSGKPVRILEVYPHWIEGTPHMRSRAPSRESLDGLALEHPK